MSCDSGCSVSRAGIWPYAPLMAVLLVPVLAAGERAVREITAPAAEVERIENIAPGDGVVSQADSTGIEPHTDTARSRSAVTTGSR